MLKAELIDKNNRVIAVVRQIDSYPFMFRGIISIFNAGSECERFLAEFQIKWDGCSKFWYYGSGYPYNEKIYPYYYKCGLNDYYKTFIAELFAFEVAKYYFRQYQERENIMKYIERCMNEDLNNTMPKINIFDYYYIKYATLDPNNDSFYQDCIRKAGENEQKIQYYLCRSSLEL